MLQSTRIILETLQDRQASLLVCLASVSMSTLQHFLFFTLYTMSEKKSLIVAAVMPNHPSGTRRRAGFVFTVEPIVYEVTEEQKKEILADQYLRIITKGVALSDAMEAYKKKSEGSSELSDMESAPSAEGSNNPENLAPAA